MRTHLAALVVLLSLSSTDALADARTLVTVNGKAMPVFFNDGDSFRVLEGSLSGTKARLAGFNTLESHGPVHRWGEASTKEMYVVAKMATLFGRRGVWSCTSDMKTDTYGRALLHCPDLAEAMIRRGFAHAMTVTADPADARLLDAQKEAIEKGRGIWSQGTPEWVLTSLHSVDERPDKPTAYNRLVSTADGHSEKIQHTRRYEECEEVCVYDAVVSEDSAQASIEALQTVSGIGEHFQGLEEAQQRHLLRFWMMGSSVAALVPRELREAYRAALGGLEQSGTLTAKRGELQSCMVYVDFKRRFGGDKAKCLK